MSKISNITPIKNGMSKNEAAEAITSFIKQNIVDKVISHDQIQSQEIRKCGIRDFKVIILKDDSEWVQGTGGIERLIGANYLSDALKSSNLNEWQAVETKFIIKDPNSKTVKVNINTRDEAPLKGLMTIDCKDFISVSKYSGNDKPGFLNSNLDSKFKVKEFTGFNDMGMNANLREQPDGSIIIIDTEYGSFSSAGVTPVSDETAALLNGVTFEITLADLI